MQTKVKHVIRNKPMLCKPKKTDCKKEGQLFLHEIGKVIKHFVKSAFLKLSRE